jgi:hypothetical protein
VSSSGKETQLVGELALVRDDLEAALADKAELETALGLLDRNSKKQIDQLQVRACRPGSLRSIPREPARVLAAAKPPVR